MKTFLIKTLLKILGDNIYQPGQIELQKMQDWLYKSHADVGAKHYYTLRKKKLMSLLSLDIDGNDRIKSLGRLEELKALSANFNKEFERRKNLKIKH